MTIIEGNVFLKVPVQNGFYLQFADLTKFKMESVSFTVSLCHEDAAKKLQPLQCGLQANYCTV